MNELEQAKELLNRNNMWVRAKALELGIHDSSELNQQNAKRLIEFASQFIRPEKYDFEVPEAFDKPLKEGDKVMLNNEPYRVAGLVYLRGKGTDDKLYKYLLEKVPDSRI